MNQKKIGIMQPYFFPYIGYFQLINLVDEFVVYDNIQYTKKGWINRNTIFSNGEEKRITLPLKKDSDYLNVVDRQLSDSWQTDRKKMLNLIRSSYSKAPFFETCFPIVENILLKNETNLFRFIFHSILEINRYLDIDTKITISSSLDIDHTLKSKDKVISICKELNGDIYVNSIGGQSLYCKNEFLKNKIYLFFIKSGAVTYPQFDFNHLPNLSIVDIMMFNSKDDIKGFLKTYELL